LRIGYVSADFREHSVATFLEPLIEHHDRRNFEVVCYSDVEHPDAVTSRMKSYCSAWRDTRTMSDGSLADLIRNDGIDVLVDPSGHMGGGRMKIFALKPAPIQVAFPGYPGRTGIAAMDGMITDALQDPESDDAEAEA